MSKQTIFSTFSIAQPNGAQQLSPGDDRRLSKFRGREVKNILRDLDQSFNHTPCHSDHPAMMYPHPFYPSSPSSKSSSSRSSSQRSLIRSYQKRRMMECEWTCCCKATIALIILILLAWGIAVPLYFLGMFSLFVRFINPSYPDSLEYFP